MFKSPEFRPSILTSHGIFSHSGKTSYQVTFQPLGLPQVINIHKHNYKDRQALQNDFYKLTDWERKWVCDSILTSVTPCKSQGPEICWRSTTA